MEALKAVVRSGRLILNDATDLPEVSEVELAVVRGHNENPEPRAELEASEVVEAQGRLVDFEAVMARLGTKQVIIKLTTRQGRIEVVDGCSQANRPEAPADERVLARVQMPRRFAWRRQ